MIDKYFRTKAPEKYSEKIIQLQDYISEHHPVVMVEQVIDKKWNQGKIYIIHRSIGKEAKWEANNKIIIDFSNDVKYCWMCVCHEFAHLLLRQSPAWYESKDIKKMIQRNKSYKSKKVGYTFQQAFEQILATFIQAACEEKIGLRKLKWSQWGKTFKALDIEDLAKIVWDSWKDFLKGSRGGTNYRAWVAQSIRRIDYLL